MKNEEAATGSESINEKNWPSILAMVIANMLAFGVIFQVLGHFESLESELAVLFPAGVGLVMVRVANGILPSSLKDRLVFWRGTDALPACRAFSVYAPADARINLEKLKLAFPWNGKNEFPHAGRDQNAHWYSIYVKVQNEPAVLQANMNYLLTRDYAGISVLMFVVLGIASAGFLVSGIAPWYLPGLYVIGLTLQYLLVRTAAANYAIDVVRNGMATGLSLHLQP